MDNKNYGAVDLIARGIANEALRKAEKAGGGSYVAGSGLSSTTVDNITTFNVDDAYINDLIDAKVSIALNTPV